MVMLLDVALYRRPDRIALLAEDHGVCILASGDPLFYGIGALVMKRLGA